MSADAPLLQLEGVGRTYAPQDGPAALQDVTITIEQGEFIAVIGASGAGKSTLLNILGLLDTPSSGSYVIDGHHTQELNEHARDTLRARTFGFVFQDAHVLLKESTGKNAALGLATNQVAPEHRPGLVTRALQHVGLLPKAAELAGNLSGGERQRLAIARAITTAPRILLADEPTGALDTTNSARVMDILRELHREGVTVIMITHDPKLAQVAHRVIEISDGKVLSDHSTGKRERPQSRTARDLAAGIPRDTQGRWSRAGEQLASAISAHTVHVGRALLLLLAFTVGSAGLVTALGLSQSAAAQVVGRLDSAALDSFLVQPGSKAEAIRAELNLPGDATALDITRILTGRLLELPGVTAVGSNARGEYDSGVTLLHPNQVSEQPKIVPPILLADSLFLRSQRVRIGTTPQALSFFEQDEEAFTVALGQGLAEQLGLDQVTPGAQLWIGDTPAAVVGIIEDPGALPSLHQTLLVNPALAEIVKAQDPTLYVRTEPGAPAQLAEAVSLAMVPGNPELYQAEVIADLRSLTQGVANDFIGLISSIAWVLLALTSLSAATAVYLSVHARTTEIALRRALGEGRLTLSWQFVLEGASMGFLGGVLGSSLGVVLLVAFATMRDWTPTFDFRYVSVGLASGLITGILASVYPAIVAARQDPALAVRGT